MTVISVVTILAALLKLSHIVEAKFCSLEINSKPQYYPCTDHEYCCKFGCCVSPAFHFYQLWYYWLLVIFMFLLCSGGGWWYRYWLQSRYRDRPVSSFPHGTMAGHLHQSRASMGSNNAQPRRTGRVSRMARVSYNPTRDTVVLHHIWKGPRATIQRNGPQPPYSSTQSNLQNAEMSSQDTSHQQNNFDYPGNIPSLFPASCHTPHSPGTNRQISTQECPYYQLYGPPPSYESVVSDLNQRYSALSSPKDDVNTTDNATSLSVTNNLSCVSTTNPVSYPHSSQVEEINQTVGVDSSIPALVESDAFPSTSSRNVATCDPGHSFVCNTPNITTVETINNTQHCAEWDGVQDNQTLYSTQHSFRHEQSQVGSCKKSPQMPRTSST